MESLEAISRFFAVNGQHESPWHFDGQENFTIQLAGTKKWSLCASGFQNPITNYHPSSIDQRTKQNDYKAHRMYTSAPLPPNDLDKRCETVILRPGSVLYAPAGMWHKVESIEDGSLSINMSMDGMRWVDLLMSRLAPLLWGKPRWRERIHVRHGYDQVISELTGILTSLKDDIGQLQARDLIPPSLVHASREAVLNVENEQENRELPAVSNGVTDDLVFRRNQLSVLIQDCDSKDDGDNITFSVHHAFGNSGYDSEFSVKIIVRASLVGIMNQLQELAAEMAYSQLLTYVNDSNSCCTHECLASLLRCLVHAGYLGVAE